MSTKIEWADETWNPITGCTKVSQGCKNCYAERMAKRLAGRVGYPSDDPFKVTNHPAKFLLPLTGKWRKPRTVFVCSMGDLFHKDVEYDWIRSIWNVMHLRPQHKFMILTKRPNRMQDILKVMRHQGIETVLPNVWLGVSAEDQKTANERIPLLLQTPAAKRFVSCEPLLGPIDLTNLSGKDAGWSCNTYDALSMDVDEGDIGQLDLVIVGGESGPHARPMHPEWVRSLRDQCVNTMTPFFFKQWGEYGVVEDIQLSKDLNGLKGLTPDGKNYFIEVLETQTGKKQYAAINRNGIPVIYEKVGKKKAGRLLDGREWNGEFE